MRNIRESCFRHSPMPHYQHPRFSRSKVVFDRFEYVGQTLGYPLAGLRNLPSRPSLALSHYRHFLPSTVLLRFFRKGSVAEKTEDSNSPLKTIDPFFIRFAGAPIFIRFSSVLLQQILCGSTLTDPWDPSDFYVTIETITYF